MISELAYIHPLKNGTPIIPDSCFVAPFAVITGDVDMGDNCSIWFHSVIRGDVNSIRMGHSVNVQDGACIHCTYEKTKTQIGNQVSIGHRAIVHGCIIEDRVLIGMGAIIMDNAHIASNTIIAAGAVITEGFRCEANSIYAGVPAKKIKSIEEGSTQEQLEQLAKNYIKYSSWYTKNDSTL